MNFSFTSFLFSLPKFYILISLFLIFSLLLIFYQVLVLSQNGLILFQHRSYFLHHKPSCIVFSLPIYDLSGYIFCCQGDSQVTLWMSLCWYYVSITEKSLPSAKFTICIPLTFISLWGLCPLHAGYKQDSFPALAL